MLMMLPVLLAAASVVAPPCTTGTWITKVGDQTIFRFKIENNPTGPVVTWTRPEHFESDGDNFSGVTGVVHRPSRAAKVVDGALEMTFDDPEPHATPDIFRFRCTKAGHLEVAYVNASFEPFDFVRGVDGKAQLGTFDPGRSYARAIERSTNVEMTAIFDADQADRKSEKIDWAIVGPADEKRRKRTQALLNSGALQSGEDFYHAAFVFQHGDVANDYLKAHLLAMVAVARGKPDALWIASATLDRYLQNIGKPQVLGTQFEVSDDGRATQEPYDRTLLSDAMRAALRVPSLAEQEKQRQGFETPVREGKTP